MDLNAITTVITQVGFPIFCCVVMFRNNEKFTETLQEIAKTLEVMKNEISDLKNKRGD